MRLNEALALIAVAIAFAAAGWLGTVLGKVSCEGVTAFADGPAPGKPPRLLLILGSAVVGASLLLHGEPMTGMGLAAILCVSLVACWYADVTCGIVPNFFTLAPLAAVLGAALLHHQSWPFVAALTVFALFGAAALASKGRGMGWGDVKLAALGGALLGLGSALVVFGGACFVAAAVGVIRKRRHEPIAFAPYMTGALGVAMVAGMVPH